MADESLMVVNLDDPAERVRLMQHVGTRRGLCEVSIKPVKKTRSPNANSYYFAACVTPFMHWLRETQGDPGIDKDQAHEMLKAAVLGTKSVQLPDGCFVDMAPRTRGMKSDEFALYVEAVIGWLAAFANITVIPSELFYETKAGAK
jgi:hypothetical protein